MDNKESTNPYKVYSCRFEFSHDYTAFLVQADKQGIQVSTNKFRSVCAENGFVLPDVHVEFRAEAELEALRNVMRAGSDLHVGLQTLRPVVLDENSLERDWDIR